MSSHAPDSSLDEILKLTHKLLESIASGDWETYCLLCDPTLTAFEPEARGHLVEGLEFHRFYLDGGGRTGTPAGNTLVAPHVRLLGDDVAVVSYVRLVQRREASGATRTDTFEETRVWHCQDGQWRHVHFHRSANP